MGIRKKFLILTALKAGPLLRESIAKKLNFCLFIGG